MDLDELARVRATAVAFRSGVVRALEAGALDDTEPDLSGFPTGVCDFVCDLLGEYLTSSGLGDWEIVNGTRYPGNVAQESHAWLERDGVIVDITADQFPDIPDGVPQAWVTEDPSWHALFPADEATRRPARLPVRGESFVAASRWRKVYDVVRAFVLEFRAP